MKSKRVFSRVYRTHSVIVVDDNDRLDYYERTMSTRDPKGEWQRTHITKKVQLSV